MENKRTYTPQEVAEMCRAYQAVNGGFPGPVRLDIIKEYETHVPQNVRTIIDKLENEEEGIRSKILER